MLLVACVAFFCISLIEVIRGTGVFSERRPGAGISEIMAEILVFSGLGILLFIPEVRAAWRDYQSVSKDEGRKRNP